MPHWVIDTIQGVCLIATSLALGWAYTLRQTPLIDQGSSAIVLGGIIGANISLLFKQPGTLGPKAVIALVAFTMVFRGGPQLWSACRAETL